MAYGTAVLCPSYPARPPLCQHWVQRDEGGYSGSVIQAPAQHTHTHTHPRTVLSQGLGLTRRNIDTVPKTEGIGLGIGAGFR